MHDRITSQSSLVTVGDPDDAVCRPDGLTAGVVVHLTGSPSTASAD